MQDSRGSPARPTADGGGVTDLALAQDQPPRQPAPDDKVGVACTPIVPRDRFPSATHALPSSHKGSSMTRSPVSMRRSIAASPLHLAAAMARPAGLSGPSSGSGTYRTSHPLRRNSSISPCWRRHHPQVGSVAISTRLVRNSAGSNAGSSAQTHGSPLRVARAAATVGSATICDPPMAVWALQPPPARDSPHRLESRAVSLRIPRDDPMCILTVHTTDAHEDPTQGPEGFP